MKESHREPPLPRLIQLQHHRAPRTPQANVARTRVSVRTCVREDGPGSRASLRLPAEPGRKPGREFGCEQSSLGSANFVLRVLRVRGGGCGHLLDAVALCEYW